MTSTGNRSLFALLIAGALALAGCAGDASTGSPDNGPADEMPAANPGQRQHAGEVQVQILDENEVVEETNATLLFTPNASSRRELDFSNRISEDFGEEYDLKRGENNFSVKLNAETKTLVLLCESGCDFSIESSAWQSLSQSRKTECFPEQAMTREGEYLVANISVNATQNNSALLFRWFGFESGSYQCGGDAVFNLDLAKAESGLRDVVHIDRGKPIHVFKIRLAKDQENVAAFCSDSYGRGRECSFCYTEVCSRSEGESSPACIPAGPVAEDGYRYIPKLVSTGPMDEGGSLRTDWFAWGEEAKQRGC